MITGRFGQKLADDIQRLMVVEAPLPCPPAGVPLAGFVPLRHWDGPGGGLCADILKIETMGATTIAIVSIDTLFLDADFQMQLQSRLRSDTRLVLVASHTHFAPALAKSVASLGAVDEDYFESVLDCIADAIKSEEAAAFSDVGYFTTPTNLTINRRLEGFNLDYGKLRRGRISFRNGISLAKNASGMVDPNLRCISFFDADGAPIGCIWSLAAHAAFEDTYGAISADFPGHVRAFLKTRFGPKFVSIFVPGLAGSAIPNSPAKSFIRMTNKERILRMLPFHHAIQPLDPVGYENWSEQVGELIAERLLSLDYKPVKDSKVSYGRLQSQPIFNDEKRGGLRLDLSFVQLGNEVEILVSNGELLGEWKPLLDQLPASRGMRMVSGYGAGACFYVPPTSEIRRGGYEVDRFREAFGLEGEFTAQIDVHVCDAFEQLLTGS